MTVSPHPLLTRASRLPPLGAVAAAALLLAHLPGGLAHAQTPQRSDAIAPPAAASASPAATPAPPTRGRPITLNFANADIESVARTMAVITGRNVVMDSRVRGTITLQSEQPVSPTQAINQFAAALRMQGFVLLDADGMYKVLPEADAKLQAKVLPRGKVIAGNQIVTQVFKLKFQNANQLLPVLRPLISPNNTINASGSTTLVITDYADNLQRIARIIASMDMPAGSDVQIIPLHYGIATDLAPLVQKLMDGTSSPMPGMPAGAGGGMDSTSIVAEPRSNALIVRAPTQAQAVQAQSLILKLDQPSLTSNNRNGDAGNIWVVYLKNADAVKLAATLRAATAANAPATQGAGGYAAAQTGGAGAAQGANTTATTATSALQGSGMPVTGGKIQADPSTNSLIITASEPEYRQLRAVIDRLDTARAQIYVESLIVEVSANTLANLGVQWQSPYNNGSRVGILGTNFGTGAAAGGNILALSAGLAGTVNADGTTTPNPSGFKPNPGINLASLATFRGIPILGFVANFLQTTGNANILSTPNLITLDNEEARIMIGQNVPFVTGSYTNNNSANGAVNPFQTVSRQDVGLTLRVKPQIGANGMVKMQVYQEVSSIDPATALAANGPTTNKRTIESNVMVSDGQVLVLGGLLSDSYSNSQDKVPLLGDVPLVGSLFKNENRNRQKTNLMVFLRPIIVHDKAESQNLSLDRYDMMRNSQLNSQPKRGLVQPYESAVLPPVQHPESMWTPVTNPGPRVPAPLMYENLSPKPYFGVPLTPAPAPTPAQERPLAHAQQPAPARPGLNSDYGLAWNAPQTRPPALEQTPLKLPIQQASR